MKPKPKTKRRINYRLLRQIRDEILKEPLRFDMNSPIDIEDPAPPCGTSACIAGFAVLGDHMKQRGVTWKDAGVALVKKTQGSDYYTFADWDKVKVRAMRLLGLSSEQAERLFYDDGWPYKFFQRHLDTRSLRGKARVAAQRIDFYIKTKGTDRE